MKTHPTISGAALLSGILLAALPNPSSAQSVYAEGHADIGLAYEEGALVPHWHLDAGDLVDGAPLAEEGEYEPGELVALFSGTRAAASGSLDYLGVSPGTTIYIGGPSVAWQPYLGFGTEELDPGDWLGNITVSLADWSAPEGGAFALYTTNAAGTSTVDVFLSTANPSAADIDGIGENQFYLSPGGHDHFTFGFTTPGTYELTLEFSGTHAEDGAVSASATYGFVVVPEPSTGCILAFAGLAGLFRCRRRAAAPARSRVAHP